MSRSTAQRATVRLAARAKINLTLRILARDVSGYHQIETVFCALDHADDVELTLGADGIRLEVESTNGIVVPAGQDNLVYRAAESFFACTRRDRSAAIRLRKRIPSGAGLGGGSSNAAATLKGLNLLCGSPLNDAELVELGAQLGADVPFFLCGSSLALAWGRGQRLLPLRPLPPMPVLLVVPPFPIETRAAYGELGLSNSAATPATVIQPIRLASWDTMQEDAKNDFEAALFPRYPLLPQIRESLLDAGATCAMLSGSGSTLFGLFPMQRAAARAAKRIRERIPHVRTIETQTIAWTAH